MKDICLLKELNVQKLPKKNSGNYKKVMIKDSGKKKLKLLPKEHLISDPSLSRLMGTKNDHDK